MSVFDEITLAERAAIIAALGVVALHDGPAPYGVDHTELARRIEVAGFADQMEKYLERIKASANAQVTELLVNHARVIADMADELASALGGVIVLVQAISDEHGSVVVPAQHALVLWQSTKAEIDGVLRAVKATVQDG